MFDEKYTNPYAEGGEGTPSCPEPEQNRETPHDNRYPQAPVVPEISPIEATYAGYGIGDSALQPEEHPPEPPPPTDRTPWRLPVQPGMSRYPAERRPMEHPKAEYPPVEQYPMEHPKAEYPPVEQYPMEHPKAEYPPVEQYPMEHPKAEYPPVEQYPMEQHPVEQHPAYRSQAEASKGKRQSAGKFRLGMVAAMLAVALVGGVAGGGAATWWFTSNQPEQPAIPASVTKELATAEASSQSGAPLITPTGDITGVVEKAAVSVVEISLDTRVMTFFGVQEVEYAGSGIIISEDGYIVTNNHVVENSEAIRIRLSDGTEYEATMVGTDPKTDLAVIKVDATGLVPVTFADSDGIQVGQVAVVIGNPLGTLGGTVTSGIISAKNREIAVGDYVMSLIQTSAAVNPGNSGGGLFNANGELIGIINAKSSGVEVEGLGFAIPSNTVLEVTGDLIDSGYVKGRPELGIKVLQVDDPRAADYYGLSGTGVFVMEVTRPNNGFKAGDKIISINGNAVETTEDVTEAVRSSSVGDTWDVLVERDGEEITVGITVAEQIPESLRETLPQVTGDI